MKPRSFVIARPSTSFDANFARVDGAHANERRLRIWCAAASTGQEAYSLAMILDHEARALRGWSVEILGTDISGAAIEAARKGVYSQFEVQRGLSTSHLLGYFHRHDENWRVNEHLRAKVAFANSTCCPIFRVSGHLRDLCRNVLLYFEPEVKRDVLNRLSALLAPDGFLFLGSAESVGEGAPAFASISNDGVWRLRQGPARSLRWREAKSFEGKMRRK